MREVEPDFKNPNTHPFKDAQGRNVEERYNGAYIWERPLPILTVHKDGKIKTFTESQIDEE